jgi:hypothetical protein
MTSDFPPPQITAGQPVEPSTVMIEQRPPGAAPVVRAYISALATLDQHYVEQAMGHLAADLAAGRWQARHRDLLDTDTLDVGYRLITAD